MNSTWGFRNSKFKKEVEPSPGTREQGINEPSGSIFMSANVVITSCCPVRTYQVQVKNFSRELLNSCCLLLCQNFFPIKKKKKEFYFPQFSLSTSSIFSIVLIWCMFSETSVEGTLKKNLLNK